MPISKLGLFTHLTTVIRGRPRRPVAIGYRSVRYLMLQIISMNPSNGSFVMLKLKAPFIPRVCFLYYVFQVLLLWHKVDGQVLIALQSIAARQNGPTNAHGHPRKKEFSDRTYDDHSHLLRIKRGSILEQRELYSFASAVSSSMCRCSCARAPISVCRSLTSMLKRSTRHEN
jgi:hypothetical protein